MEIIYCSNVFPRVTNIKQKITSNFNNNTRIPQKTRTTLYSENHYSNVDVLDFT